MPSFMLRALTLGLSVLTACGSSRPHIGDDVPVAHLGTFTASTGAASVLPDVARARELVAPRLGGGKLGFDLATVDGWKEIGVDITRGVAVVADTQLMKDEVAFVVIVKVSSREKLMAAAARVLPLTLGKTEGRTQEVLLEGELLGYLGALGDRTAFMLTHERELRPAFDTYLASRGTDVAHDDGFARAFAGLPSGPGVLFHMRLDEILKSYRRIFGVDGSDQGLAKIYRGVSLRLDASGLGLRLSMLPDAARALKAATKTPSTPLPLARMVPDIGWIAMRASVDLSNGIDPLIQGIVGPNLVPKDSFALALAMLGIKWSEVAAALDGNIGFAFDPTALAMSRFGNGTPTWLVVAGIADQTKADALVEKLASFPMIRATRAQGVLLVASNDEVLRFASNPQGKTLADTPAAATLNGPGFFALSGDLSRQAGLIMMMLDTDQRNAAFMHSDAYQHFQDQPYLGLSCVADDDGMRVSVDDDGLTYGVLSLVAADALAQLTGEKRQHPLVGMVERYADDICACKDQPCVQRRTEAFSRETADLSGFGPGTEADANAITTAGRRASDCVTRLVTEPP